MTQGIIGLGTAFQYDTTGSGAFATITEVVDVHGPKLKIKDVNFSNMDSASAGEEFGPGLVDGGEFTLVVNYSKGVLAAMMAIIRVVRQFKVIIPDGSTWLATGYINNLDHGQPHNDKETLNIGIKVSGLPAFTSS